MKKFSLIKFNLIKIYIGVVIFVSGLKDSVVIFVSGLKDLILIILI